MTNDVSLLEITQATTATFTDLYIQYTFLFFVESGSKRVLCPVNGELVGEEGDLLVFPPGSMVTMENRPVMNRAYKAVGVSFSEGLIGAVFPEERAPRGGPAEGVQVIRAGGADPGRLVADLRETLARADLPDVVLRHRLLEPLVWLRHEGVMLSARSDDRPMSRVRRILGTDLAHDWRAAEVAERLAMSEATMRRALAASGQGFAKILLHTRLEQGLTRLQTTHDPISEIALDVGFKTPSHFADAFKKRFGVTPKQIRTKGD